jgi:hypothetical protein
MKSFICRYCEHVFFSTKFKPFCNPACRHAATAIDPFSKKSNRPVDPEGTKNETSYNQSSR